MTHNFECYDNADDASVTIGAKRARDTCVVEATAFCVRQGKPKGGGKGALLSHEHSLCLGTGGGTMVIKNTAPRDIAAMRYIVRRLTPTECERLMGLPDGWTIPAFRKDEITDEMVEEFRQIFDTFGAIMASYDKKKKKKPPKPKTAKWVRKWLEKISCAETCPDAPRYKACGNGWATNQPRWILERILSGENEQRGDA